MKILLQVAGIFALCMVCSGVSDLLPFVFPGSAIAMILLFLAFLLKVIRPSAIKETGGFLLNNMAFFFVPPGVALLECFSEIRHALIPIFIICVVSTFITFVVTAYTVRLACFLQKRFQERGRHRV